MPILQEAQEIYGYLPLEVQQIIAENTSYTMAEIYGVVTFMHSFLSTRRVSTRLLFALERLVM